MIYYPTSEVIIGGLVVNVSVCVSNFSWIIGMVGLVFGIMGGRLKLKELKLADWELEIVLVEDFYADAKVRYLLNLVLLQVR